MPITDNEENTTPQTSWMSPFIKTKQKVVVVVFVFQSRVSSIR